MKAFDEKIILKEFDEGYFSPTIPMWSHMSEVTDTEQREKYFVICGKADRCPQDLFVSFPKEGGVRLQSLHAMQKKAGLIEPVANAAGELEPSALLNITYEKDGDAVIMVGADGTTVRYEAVEKGFLLQIGNGDADIIALTDRQLRYHHNVKREVDSILVELPLCEKESIFGGGERFNDSNQVGHSFSLTNVDSPTSKEYTYTNIPLFHSTRGYSVWFNMTAVGWADIGESHPDKYSVCFDQPNLDVYIWAGTPLENLQKYTAITGTSGVTESWTFGFWAGAADYAYKNVGNKDWFENFKNLLEGFKEQYNFYPEAIYGESEGLHEQPTKYAVEKGVKMLMWYPPFKNHHKKTADTLPGVPELPVFDENGNMTDPGYPYPFDTQLLQVKGEYKHISPDGLLGIDFTNPNARIYLDNYFGEFWDWGVSGAMLDMGEKHALVGTYYNGMEAMEMHNFISYYYAKVHAEQWTKRKGNDYVLFLRSGTAGSQKFACNFLGDQWATWEQYKRIIYAMINMGASGYNLYGADLGALLGSPDPSIGLAGKPTDDLWNRWVVMSVFSPFMRQHGCRIHKPWSDYGALAKKIFGNYYYFRKNIVPSIMSAAIDANKTSNPMLKGMLMAYPEQTALVKAEVQYLFCDDFLVCPVLEEGVWYNKVTLPAGSTWYDLYSYKAYVGGQTMYAEAPTSTMPVFVKDGAVKAIDLPQSLTLGTEMHDASDDVFEAMPALLITAPDEEKTVTIHVKDGASEDFRTYASHTETYTVKPTADAVFEVIGAQASPRCAVLLLGVTAAAVTVDGLKLARLDHTPLVSDGELGYCVDRQGMTTVLLPEGWKTLSINKDESTYQSLSLSSTAAEAVDGKAQTAFTLPAGGDLTVQFEEAAVINRVVIKWAAGYCSEYMVEYTADGENWALLKTVTDGVGAVNVLDVTPVNVKALRLKPIKSGDAIAAPAVYAFEVYAP